MNYVESLKRRAEQAGNIVCVGLDPVLDKIPSSGCKEFEDKLKEPGKAIEKFYCDLLDAFAAEGVVPAIVKPNIAFYEQYGFSGLNALNSIMIKCRELKIPVILDGKRGDIGTTSKAYAKAMFEFWKADAITVAPYMGSDSVGPFLEYCGGAEGAHTTNSSENASACNGKGVYVLVRTSNKGAVDMQNLKVCADSIPLYMKTAEKLVELHKPGIGAVVGATYPGELEEISRFFVNSGKQVPFLIPGVGAQGGSAQDVVSVLKRSGNDLSIHRINSSSGINFAYLQKGSADYCKSAVEALKELIEEINF